MLIKSAMALYHGKARHNEASICEAVFIVASTIDHAMDVFKMKFPEHRVEEIREISRSAHVFVTEYDDLKIVDAELHAQSVKAAKEAGLSYAKWIERAIKSALVSEAKL